MKHSFLLVVRVNLLPGENFMANQRDLEVKDIYIRELREIDIDTLVDVFARHRWNKSKSVFAKYLQEQRTGTRQTWVAFLMNDLAGYVTLNWLSHYEPFSKNSIPEIMDLNVLPPFRKMGIGTALLDVAEQHAATKSPIVGIGVGVGDEQTLYIRRDYIPDGLGATYRYARLSYGQSVTVDDDLVLWFTKKIK